MKHLKVVAFIALALAIAAPAFAETQTVKVSGSLDAYHLYRRNLDLRDNNDQGSVPNGGTVETTTDTTGELNNGAEADNFFMSIAQVEVAADLTDNVSVVIRLVNQRDWNARAFEGSGANIAADDENQADEFDVVVDLAYAQMKEIFYAPLTLTIGRQDLWFGRGMIIGANYQDPNDGISANEFTAITSFDAIRATLDFNPWTIDWVYAIVDENAIDTEDDNQFHFVNVNYQFSEYKAEAEAYFLASGNRGAIARTATTSEVNDETYVVGGRAQFDPIPQMTLGGELAYQFGDYAAAATGTTQRDRSAWMGEVFGEYRFENAWNPMIGLQYVFFSGEDTASSSTDEYNAWNGLFRGPTFGNIRDWQEVFYETALTGDQSGSTNQQHFAIYGSIDPMEDLTIDAWFYWFWTDEDYLSAGTSGTQIGDEIGNELDVHITYDYTEDVAFAVWLAWFFPGDVYDNLTGTTGGDSDATATQVVSSVKVSF